MLVQTTANRQVIVCAAEEVRRHGVREGMSLAQARALCPTLLCADHQPHRDQRALESLGRWMMRFSPIVDCGTEILSTGDEPAMGHPCPPAALFLDITGCERVFGGLENLVRQVIEAMQRLHLTAKVAVAPTPGAAWALTLAGQHNGRIVTEQELSDVLAPLPATALRLDEDLLESLHHLGLFSIGQVMQFPRDLLPSRFGNILLRRIDQALGRISEPLIPLMDQPPVEARMDFEGVICTPETIWLVFQQLIGRIIHDLARRGCGIRCLEARFLRPCAPPLRKTIRLSGPSRDPVNLFNLFRCALETLETEASRRSTGPSPGIDGFVGLHLIVTVYEQLAEEQISLLDHEQYAGEMELNRLIDRLRVRLGETGIAQVRIVESYVPERMYQIAGPGTADAQITVQQSGLTKPLHLLPMPVEVRAMVSPSDDREGRPISFTHGQGVHRVAHSIGPQRIGSPWWEGRNKTRDYFDVEDPAGRRFWLFRVPETGKWYLHGMYE